MDNVTDADAETKDADAGNEDAYAGTEDADAGTEHAGTEEGIIEASNTTYTSTHQDAQPNAISSYTCEDCTMFCAAKPTCLNFSVEHSAVTLPRANSQEVFMAVAFSNAVTD